MSENNKFSGVLRLFFTSPYLLLVFFVIPVYTVLKLKMHLPVSGDLLLGNNVLFCVCIALRVVWRLLRMRGNIRYGSESGQPTRTYELGQSVSRLRTELTGVRFNFDSSDHYGERRDLGYLGGTVLYIGLLILLAVGSYDYTHEYSVMCRLGVGEPAVLDGKGLIGEFEAGFFAGASKLPLLQVRKQILPNQQWPKGATEIALMSEDNKELAKSTIAPGKPFRYGRLEYHMTKFVFDALIVINEGNAIIYESFVKFLPMVGKKGEFSYYGGLVNEHSGLVRGIALLNPADKKKIHVEATLSGNKIVDTDLELWGVNKKTQGKYVAKVDGLAQWSEIRIARGRHWVMLMIGAAFAVIGGFMRVAVRPQRVWLEEAGEGSLVRATGRKTLQLLGNPDKL
jgi:hypothetical protein